MQPGMDAPMHTARVYAP